MEHDSLTSFSNIYRAVGITFDFFVTRNAAMKECLEQARTAARTDVTMLILGENGTGKNLLAQAIHNESERRDGPFISVNCSALTETLLESELFGHEKGAFTGADRQRQGKFELARGGTLFLDEIADMSLAAQAKILHAVEYREFQRVGGETMLHADTRIVAATNRDPEELVDSGLFRRDLYFRLREVVIRVPSLRQRKEDIPLLIERFVSECNRKYRKEVEMPAAAVTEQLADLGWPGNVRELRAAVKRAVALARGREIAIRELVGASSHARTIHAREPHTGDDLSLKAAEKAQIDKVLQLTGVNKKEAARLLRISRTTLDRKILEYRLGDG